MYRKLLIVFLTAALSLVNSAAVAKKHYHKTPPRYGVPIAAPFPEDPQAYAMRVARQTWPGRALCDFGGYRIIPCDLAPGGFRP
jgi:hypothetical protein